MSTSIWEIIKKNGWYEEIVHIYGKEFPIEIRSMCSAWLSSDDNFMSFDPDEPTHHECIFAFINAFFKELCRCINAHPNQGDANFHHKQRLSKLFKRIQAQNKMHLFQVIKDTLARERQRVEELCATTSPKSPNPSDSPAEKSFAQLQAEIEGALAFVQEKCSSIDTGVPDLSHRYTTLQYHVYMLQQHQQNGASGNNGYNCPENVQIPSAEEIRNESARLTQDVQSMYKSILDDTMDLLNKVHTTVLNELEEWRDDQRLVALGKPPDKKLESIEKWFKTMAKCLEILEVQIPAYQSLCRAHNYHIDYLNRIQRAIDQIGKLKQSMIDVCVVIITEPKQIIRTSTNFGPVHLAVLPISTNMMITSVKAVFINQKTAVDYFNKTDNTHANLPTKSGELKFGKSGLKVVNNKMEYQTMTVCTVSKSSKRGEQFVVEERFWIYFRISVTCRDRSITLWTTSLPISVTSHPIQESKASTHVIWYNAFPLKSRQQRFEVPDEIPWAWLIEAINLKFLKLGKGLTNEQKDYLKERLFRGIIPSNELVSKSRFCGEVFATAKVDPELSEDGNSIKNYSYGEWLCCCLKILSWAPKNGKLAKYGLKHFWKDGRIVGFMSKEEMQRLLKDSYPGTFIIRFPENMPDYIGLYFYNKSAQTREKLLKQLLTTKDFNIIALQDRILDSSLATYLYPNIDKEVAFTRMCKTDTSVVNGYFTVGIQEYVPRAVLQSIMRQRGEESLSGVSSSHSVLSNYLSCRSISPSISSPRSDRSSTTGSYCAYSPESTTSQSEMDDVSVVTKFIAGIDTRVLFDDNGMHN